jgi:putative hemolysin
MLKKIAISLSLVLSLAACSSSEKEQSAKSDMAKPIGKANPAAVYCIEQQGSYNLENSDCTLKTGEVVNAWNFYRSSQK